jgi:hypothetical protein
MVCAQYFGRSSRFFGKSSLLPSMKRVGKYLISDPYFFNKSIPRHYLRCLTVQGNGVLVSNQFLHECLRWILISILQLEIAAEITTQITTQIAKLS